MKKIILTALSFLTLSVATGVAFAAPVAPMAEIQNSDGLDYNTLYTEASWQKIRIPLSAVGGIFPGTNLTLSVAGLPDGVSITLDGVTQEDSGLLLNVDTERSNTQVPVNAVADVTLKSGDSVLTTFRVPVLGTATEDNTPLLN